MVDRATSERSGGNDDVADDTLEDEEAKLLQQALALSLEHGGGSGSGGQQG